MDKTLEEFFADALEDSDMYKEENFEAFESDEDSMLILGQPIDDQLTTKNLASFAIPRRKKEGGSPTSGEDEEECEYEDSFESPGKSPIHTQHLNEMSSITFMHSHHQSNGFPPVIKEKPTIKKKVKRKKKRVAPSASIAAAVLKGQSQHTDVPPPSGQIEHHVRQTHEKPGPIPMERVISRGPAVSRGQQVSGPGHSRNSPRAVGVPARMNSAGAPASISASSARASSSGAPHGAFVPNSRQPPHPEHMYNPRGDYHQNTPRGGAGHTPGAGQGRPPGPASVASQVTQGSAAGRAQGVAYANGLLQRQLDNALKQVAIYRRENEALQQSLDSAGINEAVERYRALLIEKENRINQLESENNGLKSIARYQGKYLSEQARNPPDSAENIAHHEKQIEIMLIHTRKMKEKAKKLELREQELVAENERLHVQNGRIQRKNAKLKKQLADLAEQRGQAQGSNAQGGEQPEGVISTSILEAMDAGRELDSPSMQTDSAGDLAVMAHLSGSKAGVTSMETVSTAGVGAGSVTSALPQVAPLGESAPTAPPLPNTKAGLRKAIEERDVQLRKQAIMIETLERSLQTQRGRFMRDIEQYKQQATQALEEQHRLEVELDKRERFGRNQVSTLKQIRAAYDELSNGYRKLLTASELYNRDTAPPERKVVHASPEKEDPVPLKPSPPVRKLAPKAGLLSEHDDADEIRPAVQAGEGAGAAHFVPVRPQGSAGSSRAGSARILAVNLVRNLNLVDGKRNEENVF